MHEQIRDAELVENLPSVGSSKSPKNFAQNEETLKNVHKNSTPRDLDFPVENFENISLFIFFDVNHKSSK